MWKSVFLFIGLCLFDLLLGRCAAHAIPFDATSNYKPSASPTSTARARAERVGKLAPFEAFLRQRVDAARPHWIPAIVLLREIREQGWEIAPYLTTRLHWT